MKRGTRNDALPEYTWSWIDDQVNDKITKMPFLESELSRLLCVLDFVLEDQARAHENPEEVMFRYFNATGIILLVIFCSLVFNMGCQSARVLVGEDPAYRHEPPPPPRETGPPPWAPAHGYRAKYRYHYYPSSSVYYDTGRKLYFYYDGGRWQVGLSLPTLLHIDINDYVSLEMGTDKPYKYHQEVVKRYPPGQKKQKSRRGWGKSRKD
jgi:hypothetical protein